MPRADAQGPTTITSGTALPELNGVSGRSTPIKFGADELPTAIAAKLHHAFTGHSSLEQGHSWLNTKSLE